MRRNGRWSIGCFLVMLVLLPSAAVHGQNLSRAEVAARIQESEELRGSYSAVTTWMYSQEMLASGKEMPLYHRLQSPPGRIATLHEYPEKRGTRQVDFLYLSWDGEQNRFHSYLSEAMDEPHVFSISEEAPTSDFEDWIEIALGRRFEAWPTSVGELLGDDEIVAVIEEVERQGINLVEVSIEKFPTLTGVAVRYWYDPARDWMMVGFEQEAVSQDEETGVTRRGSIGRCEVIEAKEIDGIWTPWKVRWNVEDRRGAAPVMSADFFVQFRSFEYNPEVTDAEFRLSPDGLPSGSWISDSRLGISYKLGEDLLYMDGRLNKLSAPITYLIEPNELSSIMVGAEALVNPDGLELEPVGARINWRTWGGTGLFAAGFIVASFAFWKRWKG